MPNVPFYKWDGNTRRYWKVINVPLLAGCSCGVHPSCYYPYLPPEYTIVDEEKLKPITSVVVTDTPNEYEVLPTRTFELKRFAYSEGFAYAEKEKS